jgi:hypothetical protein
MKKNKYHTVGTIPKSCKTKIPHWGNNSKIMKNKKYHTVGTIPKS